MHISMCVPPRSLVDQLQVTVCVPPLCAVLGGDDGVCVCVEDGVFVCVCVSLYVCVCEYVCVGVSVFEGVCVSVCVWHTRVCLSVCVCVCAIREHVTQKGWVKIGTDCMREVMCTDRELDVSYVVCGARMYTCVYTDKGCL